MLESYEEMIEMKKRPATLLIIGCLVAALLLTVAGCGVQERDSNSAALPQRTATSAQESSVPIPDESQLSPKQEKPATPKFDYAQIYDEILESAYELLHDADDHDATDGENDIFVMATAYGADALNCVGYYIQDISGDGIPELLIGRIPKDGNGFECNNIFAVYTCVDGAPYLTFESGWYQNTYYYLEDGSFFNVGYKTVGNNGDIVEWFAMYDISPDGTELICIDFYFAYPKENGGSEIGFYRNQTGLPDPDDSQELEISDELFRQIGDVAIDQAQNLPLTPFRDDAASRFGRAKAYDETNGMPVNAKWADDYPLETVDYEMFVADDGDTAAEIIFMSEQGVTDFELMSLTIHEVYDDGTVSYSAEPIYTLDVLTPVRPLVVRMTFPGDIPTYGISYVDEDGAIHRLTLEISGKDGTLLLKETK